MGSGSAVGETDVVTVVLLVLGDELQLAMHVYSTATIGVYRASHCWIWLAIEQLLFGLRSGNGIGMFVMAG